MVLLLRVGAVLVVRVLVLVLGLGPGLGRVLVSASGRFRAVLSAATPRFRPLAPGRVAPPELVSGCAWASGRFRAVPLAATPRFRPLAPGGTTPWSRPGDVTR
jgi:hypothetical protein